MPIVLNSADWSVQPATPSRGRQRGATRAAAADFPPEFLTDESEVADEFVAQPKPATRGRPGGPDALDFSCDVGPDEAAIVSIRHPSGALTFHLPVESTSRGGRHPNQLRFVVTVRSTDVATGRRGAVTSAIKVVVIKVGKAGADKIVTLVLPKLVAAFEKNTWAKRGLKEGWLKVAADTLSAGSLAPGRPSSGERSLLLVHGTFSNAAAAYRPLASSTFFERTKGLYGDRVYAFDHFSLSRTPEENVRMLLEGLPTQTTTFDVITHSRGGLVLRTLVERADAFGPLADRFKLGHAVLVASPNEGTPLATPQRWSDTVGWVANLLELFPDNPFTIGAEFVANGLVWLARHATGDIPGLHAMDGAGELIAGLQSPPGPPENAYSALVANYNPSGPVLLRMLDTGVDQFFGSANDLVVPSEGGWRIDQPGAAHIAAARIGCFGPGGNLAGDGITHVNFFSRPETVDFLVRALSGEAQPLRRLDPSRLLPDHRLLRERPALPAAAAAAPARVADTTRPRARAAAPPAAATAEEMRRSLRITVVNGDLTFEQAPLLLGHYRSTRLTGTERVMNTFIGGAMEQSLEMGLYPLGPGTHQVFVNTRVDPESPRRMPRPKAVIVVGLGEEGKLNAAELVHTVRQAVIAWAQRSSEQGADSPAFFDLAATLLASGGTGITAGQAAQRIAQGVHEANELLAAGANNGTPWPRVGHLRLIELYLDRATEAWRSLKMQAAATPERFEITDEVAIGIGPLPRPAESGYRGADYDFITAEAERGDHGQTRIKYTLDTRRARSEVRAHHTQSSLLRDLVANASNAESNDQIGRTLFKLLVPVEMEPFLAGTGEMQIELEPETAGIPWELLDTDHNEHDADRRPWAIRAKLLRKLRTQDFRNDVRDADPNSSVLIIGEPECPPRYPRLLGARMEAQEVHTCLVGPNALEAERVRALLSDDDERPGPNARTVIDALFERPWRVVHIAGHGELPSEKGGKGGVVLSNDTFLGPDEIATMRVVPELVFVNCCHLAARNIDQLLAVDAKGGYDRVHFASGVAEELIKIGVKCVVAAGWAVNDDAAATFARTFYSALLRGNRFINAVAEAREATYDTTNNTWAAYQCYGDPDWVFRRDGADANSPTAQREDEFAGIASSPALKLALETIVVQTKFQRYKPDGQLERVRALEQRFGDRWGHLGDVAEWFGAAFVAGRDLERAIHWYERAVSAGDGSAPIKAAEQLANVRIRLGSETVERAQKQRDAAAARLKKASRGRRGADRKERTEAKRAVDAAERALRKSLVSARAEIKGGIAMLERLGELHATLERESLRGSAYKRLALIAAVAGQPAEERRAIEAAKRYYARATTLGLESQASNVFYPGLNYLAADLALNAGRRGWKGVDGGILEATKKSLDDKADADPDFWSIVGQAELQLYAALAEGRKLAAARDSLERKYNDLHERVAASWLWASAYDTAGFVLRRYAGRATPAEAKAAAALLEKLAGFAHA